MSDQIQEEKNMSHGHDHTTDNLGRITLNVSEKNLGVWVPQKENTFEFNIEIVELAREHHFEFNESAWDNDKPMFLAGHATFDMVEDLGFLTDSALDYLNSILPVGYYLDFEDGLVLFRDEDNEHTL
jgi:hypothetical protein